MAGHCSSDDAAELASKVEWREKSRQTIDEYQVCHVPLTTTQSPAQLGKAGVTVGKKER
jgi:hypothetical protein